MSSWSGAGRQLAALGARIRSGVRGAGRRTGAWPELLRARTSGVLAYRIRVFGPQAAAGVVAVVLCGLLVWRISDPTGTAAVAAQGDSRPMGNPTAAPDTGAPAQPASVAAPPVAPGAFVQAKVARHDGGKYVSLTFDDGPLASATPRVLAILAQYGVHAVFCMIGKQVAASPDLVRAVVAGGNELCDHTYTHDEFLPDKPPATIHDQLARTVDALHTAAPDAVVRWYRAPGGNWKHNVMTEAVSQNLQCLGWSVDTNDWKRPGVASILATIDREVTPGAVILMHDGGGDRSQTITALPQVIERLRAEGYTLVLPDGTP